MIYWNIAHNGRHLFRTDQYDHYDPHVDRIREVLRRKFPRSEGYTIDQYKREDVWTSTPLANGKQEPVADTSVSILPSINPAMCFNRANAGETCTDPRCRLHSRSQGQ